MRELAEASIWIRPDGVFNIKKEVRAELIVSVLGPITYCSENSS